MRSVMSACVRIFAIVVMWLATGCTTTRELMHADWIALSSGGSTLVASNVTVNAYKPADLLGAAVKGAVGGLK